MHASDYLVGSKQFHAQLLISCFGLMGSVNFCVSLCTFALGFILALGVEPVSYVLLFLYIKNESAGRLQGYYRVKIMILSRLAYRTTFGSF